MAEREKQQRYQTLSTLFSDHSAGFRWLFESVETTLFGVLVLDAAADSHRIVYANPAATEMTGYGSSELQGRTLDVLRGDDHTQAGAEQLRTLMERQQNGRAVLRHYRKNGRLFWNEVTSIPIKTETGQLKCFVQILKDISNCQQVQSEKELVEDRLRALLSASTDAVITIDERGIIQDVSTGIQALFGYEPHEVLGQNVSILMPSPDRERHDDYIARFLESGQPRVIGVGREVIACRKDGRRFPAHLAIGPVKQQRLFTGILRDLSLQKQSEDSLAREHQLNDNIISTSRGIILILDSEGRIVRFNKHFETLAGWKLEEVQGQEWSCLFVRERERGDFQRRFREALAGVEEAEFHRSVLTRNGATLQIQWETVPTTSRTGAVTGLLCNGLDVTEQRRLELELLEAAAAEQRRIGQDLHDVVGQELTGMAMLADSLRLSLKHQGIAEAGLAERIAGGVSSALMKVRMLSRGLNPVDVDSAGLMAALNSIANRIADIHQLECRVDCPRQVHLCDNRVANQLYRIAEEATTNAIKHAQPTRIVIGLYEEQQVVKLTIQDDGRGMEKEPHETGLGLRIMRYRAQQIGGRFQIASSLETGTCVSCQVLNE